MPEVKINTLLPKYSQISSRYLTNRQLKQKNATLEGVVVNNFIKDVEKTDNATLDDTYNTLVISNKSDENVEKYIVGSNVIFQQGAGRNILVPIDIVQDIIGIIPDIPRRVA